MRLFLCVIIMMNVAMVQAQLKPVYTASVEAGLLRGNNDKSSAFMFSNGIHYKNLSAGIGVGFDNYVFRSVPLFLDIKKDFGHRRIQPFVNVSSGINISAVKQSQKDLYYWYDDEKFKTGFFAKATAGISVRVLHKLSVFTSFGYNYKTTRVTYGMYSVAPGVPPNYNTDIYRQNRWYVAAGFCF